MSVTRNHVTAVLGGAVVLFAVLGLMEVQDRAGPFEEEVRPFALPLTVSGTLERSAASGNTGPGGVCLPDPPATECRPAAMTLDLQIGGLPVLPPPAAYQVWLDGDEQYPVGPLAEQGGAHRIDVTEERDATGFTRLFVTAESSSDATGGAIVYAREVRSGSGTVQLEDEVERKVTEARGEVVLREIGGVAISTTADLTITGLESYPGWNYRAWLIDGSGTATDLGSFEPDPEGPVTLDARVEHLPLEDQERFVVFLEPFGAETIRPSGLPVAEARLG